MTAKAEIRPPTGTKVEQSESVILACEGFDQAGDGFTGSTARGVWTCGMRRAGKSRPRDDGAGEVHVRGVANVRYNRQMFIGDGSVERKCNRIKTSLW